MYHQVLQLFWHTMAPLLLCPPPPPLDKVGGMGSSSGISLSIHLGLFICRRECVCVCVWTSSDFWTTGLQMAMLCGRLGYHVTRSDCYLQGQGLIEGVNSSKTVRFMWCVLSNFFQPNFVRVWNSMWTIEIAMLSFTVRVWILKNVHFSHIHVILFEWLNH